MKVFTAPEEVIIEDDEIAVFLAGGICNCPDWQKEAINQLRTIEENGEDLSHLVVFNPRRENFPIDDPSASEVQIKWEFDMLNQANIFSMYFCNSPSDQPICMYELGRNLMKHSKELVVITVEEGYRRKNDVIIQTELATTSNDVVRVVNDSLEESCKDHALRILKIYKKVCFCRRIKGSIIK